MEFLEFRTPSKPGITLSEVQLRLSASNGCERMSVRFSLVIPVTRFSASPRTVLEKLSVIVPESKSSRNARTNRYLSYMLDHRLISLKQCLLKNRVIQSTFVVIVYYPEYPYGNPAEHVTGAVVIPEMFVLYSYCIALSILDSIRRRTIIVRTRVRHRLNRWRLMFRRIVSHTALQVLCLRHVILVLNVQDRICFLRAARYRLLVF